MIVPFHRLACLCKRVNTHGAQEPRMDLFLEGGLLAATATASVAWQSSNRAESSSNSLLGHQQTITAGIQTLQANCCLLSEVKACLTGPTLAEEMVLLLQLLLAERGDHGALLGAIAVQYWLTSRQRLDCPGCQHLPIKGQGHIGLTGMIHEARSCVHCQCNAILLICVLCRNDRQAIHMNLE